MLCAFVPAEEPAGYRVLFVHVILPAVYTIVIAFYGKLSKAFSVIT